MYLWIILAVYMTIVVGFFTAICFECKKHSAKVGVIHVVTALLWPFWLIWYGLVLFSEWKQNGRA